MKVKTLSSVNIVANRCQRKEDGFRYMTFYLGLYLANIWSFTYPRIPKGQGAR